MKKRITTLAALLILSMYGYAQKTINGKVVDKAGVAVPFATVKVINKTTNKIIEAKLVDTYGYFKLKYNQDLNQILSVSEVGYETASINTLTIKNKDTDTLTIVLKEKENLLNTVNITATKRLITQKIDRVVMNISNNPLTANKSSLEIINIAPGVFVNNGSISINGNEGTRIMVNGRLLQLRGDDLTNYLNTLRADDIASIEVIAHPPAEYDAQGTGGMINIILKKQTKYGFNGSFTTGYTQGYYPGTNEALRINLKDKNLAVFANYDYNYLESTENSRISRLYNNELYSFSEQTNRFINKKGERFGAGIIYNINSKQYISIDYSGSLDNRTSPYNSIAEVNHPDVDQDIINKGSFPITAKTIYNNIGINYNIILDQNGSSFQLLADYTHNSLTKTSVANSSFYNYNNIFISDTSFRNSTPSYISVYTADVKYTKVFKNQFSLSGGVKATSTEIDNSAQFDYQYNGTWYRNYRQDYIYNYSEKILAEYLNFSGKILNTDLKLGFRGEYTRMSGDLVNSNDLTARNYFNLFPSLFAKHALNDKGDNYITLYYGKRLARPEYNNLNPYQSYIDNYSIAEGNPYLNPSYTNVYEAGYTLQNKFSFKLSYQKDNGTIAQYIKADDSNPLLWIYTYENFGKSTNLAFSANIPITITRWWETYTNVQLRDQEIMTPDLKIKKGIAYIQTNQDFKISQNTSLDLSAFYISNVISGNLLVNALYSFDIGAQHRFLNKRLILKSSITDPFYTYKINGTAFYKDYSSHIFQDKQTRTFNLSLTYNFNIGKSFKTQKLQQSSEDEQKRL